jgi:SAM-dependent methyltransferase
MRRFAALVLSVAVPVGLAPAEDKKDERPELAAPFLPTRPAVVDAMLKLADVKEGETVYDLGCGDGRIAIAAVGPFKARRGLGMDWNSARLKDCEAAVARAVGDKKLTAEQAKKLTFVKGDVLKLKPEDLKDVDVVTLYLLPQMNKRLKPILQKGLKPTARTRTHFTCGW